MVLWKIGIFKIDLLKNVFRELVLGRITRNPSELSTKSALLMHSLCDKIFFLLNIVIITLRIRNYLTSATKCIAFTSVTAL